MMLRDFKKCLLISGLAAVILSAPAESYASQFVDEKEGWYVGLHSGQMTFDDTSDIFLADFGLDDSYLTGVSFGKEVYEISKNITLDFESQFFKHFEGQSHEEYNLVAILKVKNLALLGNISSSLSIGNGVSFASEVPSEELRIQGADGSNDMLNYIMAEKAFKIPNQNYEISFRYHHRSGVFGLYGGAREASTAFLVGIKYNFDL